MSAAISDYILYFAKEFDFEFIIAAKLEQKNDIATGELNEPLVYGSLKVDKLKELFIDLELQHYNIVGISDSIHDLPLLEWCNDPVVILDVCPELTKVGRERQWELL
ncbi:HAD family hydrolase [Vibrio bathopelagicus]|uniref:HAD family hydrolase n=1 Tax=Vibrio bathopelagicus TaxID=2777577 RepID=UPI0018647A7D|nr:HAD family hydrolase [Vibrio bathopelagicus]